MYKIPLSVPNLKGKEWKYVKDCIDTEWVSSAGKYVQLFEHLDQTDYPNTNLELTKLQKWKYRLDI